MCQLKKAAAFSPRTDIAEGIHAYDEEEFLIRSLPAQDLEGMHGIALPLSTTLNIRSRERGIIRNGRFDHGQALGEGNPFRDGFMRRIGGGNEEDPVEGAHLAHLFGDAQVCEMDGIERAAQDADSHKREG